MEIIDKTKFPEDDKIHFKNIQGICGNFQFFKYVLETFAVIKFSPFVPLYLCNNNKNCVNHRSKSLTEKNCFPAE